MSTDPFLPCISVDCVIFGFHDGILKVLLCKFSYYSKWMLPGGFIGKDENVDAAALRVLFNRTGLEDVNLRQFHLFGNKNRTKLDENEEILLQRGFLDPETRKNHWFLNRFVSIAYYTFVEYSKVKIENSCEENIAWFGLDEIPELYSDHNDIINTALSFIRMRIYTIPMGYELLPEKFSMTELRLIYEAILGQKLDRRNFQRKMLSTGLINKLNEKTRKFGVKSSTLFSFDKDKYEQSLKNGIISFY